MKVGDLVRWKHADFITDDLGIVVEIPEYPTASDQFDMGDRMITVFWQKNTQQRALAKIRAHYLEVVSSVSEPEGR